MKLMTWLKRVHIRLHHYQIAVLAFLIVLLSLVSSSGFSLAAIPVNGASDASLFREVQAKLPGSSQNAPRIYLPIVAMQSPWHSLFGVEAEKLLMPNSTLLLNAEELHIDQLRINFAISWRVIQPEENGAYDWSSLNSLESSLRALNQAGIRPVVIVDDYPHWATRPDVREDGQPTSCGALKADKLDDFAAFVRALVARYTTPEFNVHTWELGNEPDLDPNDVDPDNVFGCWGDKKDFFYGGRAYGEMIKIVGQGIRQVDPGAEIWLGGLLLVAPTANPATGGPGAFLRGVLKAGAGPYFDGVPYHYYPPYTNRRVDHDMGIGGHWKNLGGGIRGKARYIRQVLSEYGYSKPVYMNESGLMCPSIIGGVPTDYCDPPRSDFFQMQADYIVRSFVRGASENILGFSYYTLNGPGWRNVGLLDENQNPRPAFYAYKQLVLQLDRTHFLRPVNYSSGIEAYAFRKGGQEVHVVWAYSDESLAFKIPMSKFIQAVDRDGNSINPTVQGSDYVFTATFTPVYVTRLP